MTIIQTDRTYRAWGGSGKGISTHGDVLVNMTADGVDLQQVWDEIAKVTALWKQRAQEHHGHVQFPYSQRRRRYRTEYLIGQFRGCHRTCCAAVNSASERCT
jgi:hypothetical protein